MLPGSDVKNSAPQADEGDHPLCNSGSNQKDQVAHYTVEEASGAFLWGVGLGYDT